MNGTLIDLSRWWTAIRPNVPALVTADDQLTYKELDIWAEALGAMLIEKGVQPGDRVTVMAANCLEYLVLTQGILRAGAIYAPVNPRFTFSEASYMTEQFEPRFIFYDAARKQLAEELAAAIPGIELIELSSASDYRRKVVPRIAREIDSDMPIVIIPTSGSTARPKGVVYSHRSMVGYCAEFAFAEPDAAAEVRVILFAPMCTSAGFVVLTQFLAYGGTLYMDNVFDPDRALQWVVEKKMTMFMGAPVFFERIASCKGFADADMSSIRFTSVGGARVTQKLLDAYLTKGILLRQIYGQTEAGGNATVNTIEASRTNPEKCGRGMPFSQLAVIDVDGKRCPTGIPGEIICRGPGQMMGYWRNPEATAKTIVDGWLHTGDLGVMDEDGLLTMLDRIKDIIISGGLNISAAEVERVVSEFPGVIEVAAIAAHDDKFGETPLVALHATTKIDVAALIAHCDKHLSNYKVPRYVVIEPEPLHRVATGKISKPVLREKYKDAHLRLRKVR